MRERVAIGFVLLAMVAMAACRAGDRLSVVSDEVAFDSRTGLEWTRRDHVEALAWEGADRWCRELVVGGRSEWRLPEIGELQAIYEARFAEPCGDRDCHLDPAIRVTGPYLWTVTTRGPGTRFYFDASYGTSFSPTIQPALVRRVLCVRTAAAR